VSQAEWTGQRKRTAAVAAVVGLLLAGGAVGVTVANGAGQAGASDAATISPAVTGVQGEQVVLVHFDRGTASVAADADALTVDRLRERARESQAPLGRYAASMEGVTVLNRFWLGNLAVVRIDHDRAAVTELAAIDGVTHVGPNPEVRLDTGTPAIRKTASPAGPTPSEGVPGTAVDGAAANTTYGLDQIGAPALWSEYGTQGEGVSVAVLDTGVDPDHPAIDIPNRRWNEWARDGTEIGSNPHDYQWHGTHVSGTVTGGPADGRHVGVAPDAELWHGAVLTECEEGACRGTFAQVTAGIQWAVENDVDVVSMSLSVSGFRSEYAAPIRDARRAGTVVVASIGNWGAGYSGSPGNVYDALSAGASTAEGDVWGGSSGERVDTEAAWGEDAPAGWPATYVVPTVVAPGESVLSAYPGGDYARASGTSMAAPHLAGAVALLRAATAGNLTVAETERALVETAEHPDGDARDTRYGDGIIDVESAADLLTDNRSASFAVTVTGTNGPVTGGDAVTVDATVENTGDRNGTQSVALDIPGLGGNTTAETLQGGESTNVSLGVATGPGDAGEYVATVTSANDSDPVGVTVRKPASFVVRVTGTNAPVSEGEQLLVDATVENTGDESDSQTVALRVGGQQRDAIAVGLDGNESTGVLLSWETDPGDAGEYVALATTPNGSAQTRVVVTDGAVGPPPIVGDDPQRDHDSADPPRDLDGDGLYRDVDGDGALTVADVRLFVRHWDSDAVQEHAGAFDFDGDGDVTVGDAGTLLETLLEQT
jgi:subtilisin family serine protease